MSSINGPISRSEVISRAQNWVDRQVPYSQSAYSSDPEGDKTYRQDCSGYVSMCWHLDTSLTTSTLPGRATAIGFADVKAGDAVAYSGHVALAAGPVSGSNITIYQERSPGYVAQKVTNPISLYSNAYRYNNITDTDNAPIGKIDVLTQDGVTVHVAGWALSTATTAPLTVQIAVDGGVVAALTADMDREDLVGPYNVGPNHGFDTTFLVSGGPHPCVINAINGNVQPPVQATIGTATLNFGTGDEGRMFLNAAAVDLLGRPSDLAAVTDADITNLFANGVPWLVGAYVGSEEHFDNCIVQPAYQAFLGRLAAASELQTQWSGIVSGMSEKQVVANIAASDESWWHFGGSASAWVANLYQAFLDREGTADEIANTVNAMTNDRHDTVNQFISSQEFGERIVKKYYLQMLCRPAEVTAVTAHAATIMAGNYHAFLAELANTAEYWVAAQGRS